MPDGSGRRFALPPGMEPRYLSREEAAAYLGVSPDTFDSEVLAGQWPAARRRGAKGTRLTWDRRMLDAYADHAAGIGPAPHAEPVAQPDPLPIVAAGIHAPRHNPHPQKLTAEAAALRGLSDAAPRHRAKHRQSSPA